MSRQPPPSSKPVGRPSGPPPGSQPPPPPQPRGPPPGSRPGPPPTTTSQPPLQQQPRPGPPQQQLQQPGGPARGPPPGSRPGPPPTGAGPPQGHALNQPRPGPGPPPGQQQQRPPPPASSTSSQPQRTPIPQPQQPVTAVRKVVQPPPPAEDEDIEENYDYDDDFVDDFEEEEKTPVKPPPKPTVSTSSSSSIAIPSAATVQQMIAQENQQLQARVAPSIMSGPAVGGVLSASNQTVPVRKYVPLPSKQQRATAAGSKELMKKDIRARKILQQVSLSIEKFDTLFNMDPLTKLELAKREKQKGLTRDMGCQYNEDWLTQESQTDDIDTYTLGVQAPDDLSAKVILTRTSSTSTGTDMSTDTNDLPTLSTLSTARLSSFLSASSLVVETLLSEGLSLGNNGAFASFNSAPIGPMNAISNAALQVRLPKIFGYPRPVRDVVFSKQRNASLIVAYGKVDLKQVNLQSIPPNRSSHSTPFEGLLYKGLVVIWDLLSPSYPSKVLILDGTPSTVGMDYDQSHIIFAGTDEGSVAVWDLREDANNFRHIREDGANGGVGHTHVLRPASFSSDCMINDNHETGVRKVTSLAEYVMKQASNTNADQEPIFDLSSLTGANANQTNFQFVSLDEIGGLFVWSGIELAVADPAGSEIDHGLAPGSRIKLVRSTTLTSPTVPRVPSFDVAFKPDETNEFIVSLGRGQIRHSKRHGADPTPTAYFPNGSDPRQPSANDAASLQFHPFYPDYFLAGFTLGGDVSLFHLSSARPLQTWSPPNTGAISTVCNKDFNPGVTQVVWSTFRPSVFYVVDARGTILIYDLVSKSPDRPIGTVQIAPSAVISLSLKSFKVVGLNSNMLAYPLIAGETPTVEVQSLKSHLSTNTEHELQQLTQYFSHLLPTSPTVQQ